MSADSKIFNLKKGILLILFLIGLGFGFKIIAYSIKTDKINQHLFESADVFMNNVYTIGTSYDSNGELDMFTEDYLMNGVYSVDTEHPVVSALNNPVYAKEENASGGAVDIASAFYEKDLCTTINFRLYWWGAAAVSRFILVFLNYSEMMHYVLLLCMILFAYSAYLINKRLGRCTFGAYILSFLCVAGYYSYFMMVTAMPYLVATISVIIFCKKNSVNNIFYNFIIIGFFTAYLDWMSTPIVSYCIPALVLLLIIEDKHIHVMLASTLGWMLGYGITVISKFIISELVLHDNILLSAREDIIADVSKDMIEHPNNIVIYIYESLRRNVSHLEPFNLLHGKASGLLVLILIISAISIVCVTIQKRDWQRFTLIFVALSPIVWDIVFHGHVYVHEWFTYRNLWGMIFALIYFYIDFFRKIVRNITNVSKRKGVSSMQVVK